MSPRVGCDLVCISRFAEKIRDGGEPFLQKIFHRSEYEGASLERLAGIFAIKEAACKALAIPPGEWLTLQITHDTSGAPLIQKTDAEDHWPQVAVSLSHDGDYALAVVIAL